MLSLKIKQFTKKTLQQNLKLVYGLSFYQIKKVCQTLGIHPLVLLSDLSGDLRYKLYKYIEENILVEGPLKKFQRDNNKFLIKTKTIRSLRNKVGLPVRGQRTHTNSQTKRKLKNG